MSAVKYVEIRCDQPVCGDEFHSHHGHVRKARAEARLHGWRYVPGHPTTDDGRDLCPEHRPTEETRRG